MAAIMPDLAGLNDVADGTSPCVTAGGSGSGELHPISSPATETKDRRSKNCFHFSTDGVGPYLQLSTSSTLPGGLWCRVEGNIAKLAGRTTENVPKPPQSPFLNGLRYPRYTIVADADCLICDEVAKLNSQDGPQASVIKDRQSLLIFSAYSPAFTPVEDE
ncbi:unnamed protein product [Dibothriocephalus latus]|uniref:Uncharacterized protein n=1 Tax=Dibothriocephalus latus TaxID=60516 RepID=A0A3P6SL77_DIBLA|nr:unnamed protein product [Dibothriocephalus latus]